MKGLTLNHLNHFLEWGLTGSTEWLFVSVKNLSPSEVTKLSFHLQNHHRMDTFVKTALFLKIFLKRAERPFNVFLKRSKRWSTLNVLVRRQSNKKRLVESVVLNGLTLNGSTQNLIALVRPKRFDFSRWFLTLRVQTVAKTRWALYLQSLKLLVKNSQF